MPTIVLLDTSLSMRRPVSKSNQDETRHGLACKGLEWFFQYLGKLFPYEYTSFLTFSSSCETLSTFTRDYKHLTSKLESIPFNDRTDLYSALVTVVDMVVAEWDTFAPCQVIMVTDGSPGVIHQDAASHRKQTIQVPFSCNMSIVCVCTREELGEANLQRLCETVNITSSEVFVAANPLGVESVRGAFKEVAKSSFSPFSCMLKCGHLQSRVSLSPSPSMYRAKCDIVVSTEQRFPKLDESLGGMQFPGRMEICGFLDSSHIPAPPHYSRHFVLDPEADEKSLELKSPLLLSPPPPAPPPLSEAAASASDEAQKPSFRVLLHGSLKCESKTALVRLGEEWYGFLFSQTSASKKANLVLCVLYPKADLPWLGKMKYLGPKSPEVGDPRVQSSVAVETSQFPVGPSHLPSFHTPSNLFWVKESVLQTDVSKVIRYSRKLPDKEASLLKELNKLRLVALTYCMPELLEVICSILMKEQGATSNQQTQTLLKQCIYFLTHNKNPQDRLVIK